MVRKKGIGVWSCLMVLGLIMSVGCSPGLVESEDPIANTNNFANSKSAVTLCDMPAPNELNCACEWTAPECGSIQCTCECPVGGDCLFNPDGSTGNEVLNNCDTMTCTEDDYGLSCEGVSCLQSAVDETPPPEDEYPPEGEVFCKDDEDEQIYPVGTSYDSMEEYQGNSSNWVIIEDNEPMGGAVGPEDRQWFVEDGEVMEQGRGGTVLSTDVDQFLADMGATCP